MTTSGPDGGPAAVRPRRIIGVYDADGTVWGEVSYWIGARLGRAHCSLCDITHGSVRARPEWVACTQDLDVPFETYHRNDQPDEVRSAARGTAPVVVAETDDGCVLLLGPDDIERCDGVEALIAAVDAALAEHGLAGVTE